MRTGCLDQLTLWDLGSQQVTVTFQGGRIVSEAGLLGIRKLDKGLGVSSLLAERLPDPRTQKFVTHSRETLFTQQVYQILAGYPDCNDAQTEQPIGELKNGLLADRLSFHHFRANSWKLLEHVMAFALVILHREATAAIPEIAKAQVNTLRTKLWKVAAIVKTSVRRIWFHFSETWPHQNLWQRVYAAIVEFVAQVQQSCQGNLTTPGTPSALLM